MSKTHLDDLEQRMAQAVAAEDFEAAGKLRDEIVRLRRDAKVLATPEAETPQAAYFQRQTPGRMGLGTDRQVYAPPPGWVAPVKPDPMTRGHSRGGRRRKP